MTARRDRIDLRRTYLPLNPEEFPANLPMNMEQEHENRTPVFAYEGYNILPRASGYSSFFGTNRTIGLDGSIDGNDWIGRMSLAFSRNKQ